MFTPQKLSNVLKNFPDSQNYWIGFSGGLDSTVLLHALSKIIDPKKLHAIHIHHGWHIDADDWVKQCASFCQKLNIDFHNEKVNAKNIKGESPEACARDARYKAFSRFIQSPSDFLLTAHQQDDQAETLLIQLFRGAGIDGLAAMPEITAFSEGFLC